MIFKVILLMHFLKERNTFIGWKTFHSWVHPPLSKLGALLLGCISFFLVELYRCQVLLGPFFGSAGPAIEAPSLALPESNIALYKKKLGQ